jgi:hypothetical protein
VHFQLHVIHLSGSSDRLVRRRNWAANVNLLNPSGRVELKVGLSRVHTNTLLAKEINQKRARLVVPLGKAGLVVLVLLHVVNVLVKQVGRVHGSAFGFGVELRAEDGARVVDETLVGLVIQVGEVLPPLAAESGWVNSVSVILRSDVALSGGEVQSRNVMGTVAVLELDGLGSRSESDELVTHTYAHHGDLGSLEQLAEVIHGGGAVSGVTGSVGDENTIEVVGDFVDRVVEGEASNASTSGDETTKNVLLDTTVDQSNVHVAERRADVEGSLGRHTTDQVNGLRVNVGFILVGIVLLTNGDTCEGRTLLTEVCHNLTRVDAGDGGNTLTSAPLSEGLDCGPVAVLQSIVLDNDTGSLDVGRLEVSEQAMLIACRGRDAVVADQGLSEDENLSTIGWVGHRFRVPDERGGEDSFAGDVGFCAERLARENGAILSEVSKVD